MTTLILTPNKNEMCGMYQLAKDLAKELDADIHTWENIYELMEVYDRSQIYDEVITFLYPMHKIGRKLKENYGVKWICYDQKVPPPIKLFFPNFWRRQYMKWFFWANKRSMKGADESWELSEREQKPRWTKKHTDKRFRHLGKDDYAIYLGRKTDYKNFGKLKRIMDRLGIPLLYFENPLSDDWVHYYLSNAKLLVTASTWEGYGRPVMEAQALRIPVVCFDTGVHKKLVTNGVVVNNFHFETFKEAVRTMWSTRNDK